MLPSPVNPLFGSVYMEGELPCSCGVCV